MSAKKMFLTMCGLAGLVSVGVIAALFFCLSVLRHSSNDLVAAKLDNRVIESKAASLADAKQAIAKYAELNSIARAVVPQDKGQANAVRTLSKIASDLDIKLSGISFPPSTLGQAKKVSKKQPVTQVTSVKGIKGVFELQITVQQDVTAPITYNKFIAFMRKLEANRRTAQVDSITISPSPTNRNLLSFNLVLDAYIKP